MNLGLVLLVVERLIWLAMLTLTMLVMLTQVDQLQAEQLLGMYFTLGVTSVLIVTPAAYPLLNPNI